MARKRVKQYLTLLMAIGVIAVVAGGSGTFASFNAEVANTGNTFATGSLILNDNGGTTTCTSSGNSGNANNASTNGCDTLFTLKRLDDPSATLTASASANATTLTVGGGIQGASIDKGDSLTITQGSTTENVTAAAPADLNATSISVSALTNSYTSGATVTDNSATYYAKVTLTNAGTLPASDIKFDQAAACSTTAQEGTTTLNGALTSGTSYSSLTVNALSGAFSSGDPVVVTDGGTHTQTFIASANAANGATAISVQAQKANFGYANGATVSGPSLGSGDLCSILKLSIIETDSNFDHSSPAATGCAYGTALTTYGCTLSSGTAFSTVPTSLTALTLASGGGTSNTGTQLSASGSRYFLLAVKKPSTSFDNTYQNRALSFGLTWHIDQ